MTTVVLKADEGLLLRATEVLAGRQTTLDQLFDGLLRDIVNEDQFSAEFSPAAYDELMARLARPNAGGKVSRDEMNDR